MTDRAALANAKRAVRQCFFWMGVPIGMLVPRLAEIKAGIGANDSSYGTAIALGGLGSLAGNYVGARLVHRWGSQAVARTTFVLILVSNVANALAPNTVWLAGVAVSGGLTYAMTNIAMNSQGVLVEQGMGRSFLPSAHGFWSIGSMFASFISSLIAPLVTPLTALSLGFVFAIVGFQIAGRNLLPLHMDDRPHDDPSQLPRHEPIPRTAVRFLMLVAMGQWLGLVPELGAGDWSSVFLREHFKIGIGANGFGFTAFLLAQLVTRLIGPRLVDRFTLPVVVRRLAATGATGFIALLGAAEIWGTSPERALVLMCGAYLFLGMGVAMSSAAFASAAGAIPGLPSARGLMLVGITLSLLNLTSRVGLAQFAQAFSLPPMILLTGIALLGCAALAPVLDPKRAQAQAIQR